MSIADMMDVAAAWASIFHITSAKQTPQHHFSCQFLLTADLMDVVAAWAQGTRFFDIYKMMDVFEVRC